MYRSGLGWRSFDPREAVSAVHEIENPAALRQVIFEARNPEARRLALIKLGDKALMGSFALSDPSPIVRRRMARALDDPAVLEKILEEDDDRSVRDAAGSRLDQLEKEKAAEIEKAAEEAKEQQEDSPDILERKKKEAEKNSRKTARIFWKGKRKKPSSRLPSNISQSSLRTAPAAMTRTIPCVSIIMPWPSRIP